jgi:hypothetical protein
MQVVALDAQGVRLPAGRWIRVADASALDDDNGSVGEPLGLVPELDPKSLALLEATSLSRADIAQSVEQRFRKP